MCLVKCSTKSDLVKLGFYEAILNTFTCEAIKTAEPGSGKSIFANLFDIIMEVSLRY